MSVELDKMPGVYVPQGADKYMDAHDRSTHSKSSKNNTAQGKSKQDQETGKRKKVICDRRVWNIACDMYVEKFLESLKIGCTMCDYNFNSFGGSLQDELKIYNYLMEHQDEIPYGLGTAGNTQDMIGLDKPQVYETSYSINNSFTRQFAYALAASVTKVVAKEVPYVRVVFCDAAAYDAGYLAPEDIAGRVEVKGRGGTVLQPGVDLLEHVKDFPKDGPILIITDGYIEDDLKVHREHAFLISEGNYLPFRPKGKVFHFDGKEI